MHKEKKDDIDNNKGQYTDQYSIGKERDDYFVPAIFETVNQDRPRWKRQRKKNRLGQQIQETRQR
jgi:hypothetical protein